VGRHAQSYARFFRGTIALLAIATFFGSSKVAATSARASATYSVLYSFGGKPSDGAYPSAGLINVGGTLYGTTEFGGAGGEGLDSGTVFSITTAGVETVLHNFGGEPDGAHPYAALLRVGNALYGTTVRGGRFGAGSIFQISGGTETVVHNFSYRPKAKIFGGRHPTGSLVALNGALYGTTDRGGTSDGGTLFELASSGAVRSIYDFAGGRDGIAPFAGMTAVGNAFYGTTSDGGGVKCFNPFGCGTVFEFSGGNEDVLYRFRGGTDGANPVGGLVEAGGTLYGTTSAGGGDGCPGVCGTVFSITPAGREHVLYRFQGGKDGADPTGGLVAFGGKLYGTTSAGGGSGCGGRGCGTVFSLTASGQETVLHRFQSGSDGAVPFAGLTLVDGTLYGTTFTGGAGYGTVFSIRP